MHHHKITSIGTGIILVIIKLLTLDTIWMQEYEQEQDKEQEQIGIYTGILEPPQDRYYAKCPQSSTPDGLLLANCSSDYTQVRKTVYIPQDLPSTIQVLDLSIFGGKELCPIIILETDLTRYSKLQRVIIRRNIQAHPQQDKSFKDEGKKTLANGFKDLNSLECLEISSSFLSDDFPITLPKNLKTLIINNNSYTHVSVQWCRELIELNVNYNNLQSVPKFHIPDAPPLTTLRMKQSPLPEMTILDIAPLCELTLLELEFPPKSYYLTEAAACKCQILKKWCKEVKIDGVEKIPCAESKTNCSEGILNDAKALRKKCPLLKKGKELSRFFTILKYIFFSILLLLLLACLIMYVIRHFHLKEWWAAHHASMAKSIKMEEGELEESLQDKQSTSSSDVMILCSTDTSNGETFSPIFKDSHDDE